MKSLSYIPSFSSSFRMMSIHPTSTMKSKALSINNPNLSKKWFHDGNKLSSFRFKTFSCVIPHPEKVEKGGEDAYFISHDQLVLGVADGVGGWASNGIDPALYARKLMEGSHEYYEKNKVLDVLKVMEGGYEHAKEVIGSSTACIVALDAFKEEVKLQYANLGDSGFLVVRSNDLMFQTKPLQHRFNCPFQLGTGSSDLPKHSTLGSLDMKEGDMVILGTDGLFDNLFPEQILEVIKHMKDEQLKMKLNIAEAIAATAHHFAARKNGVSPFSQEAEDRGFSYKGGKMDDITVVVGIVEKNSLDNVPKSNLQLKKENVF